MKPVQLTLTVTEVQTTSMIFSLFFEMCRMMEVQPPEGFRGIAHGIMDKVIIELSSQLNDEGREIVRKALSEQS